MATRPELTEVCEFCEHQSKLEAHLHAKGWTRVANGWRHARLETNWGLFDAVRLQQEADDGMVDPLCMAMRGEVWP